MSTTSTVDVLHVHPPFVPRGSALAAAAYTRLASFFRQLPAGVPGAYRLFANLISLGKAAQKP